MASRKASRTPETGIQYLKRHWREIEAMTAPIQVRKFNAWSRIETIRRWLKEVLDKGKLDKSKAQQLAKALNIVERIISQNLDELCQKNAARARRAA